MFVWLVVTPLVQEYLKKYKAVGAIDAFCKLHDAPEAQLLDIRRGKSVRFMAPPNLRLVGKSAVQVEFDEEDEEGFLSVVMSRFPDPANTVVCVLDNFDGNSMEVAEVLFNNGFKEAYAIKGGLRPRRVAGNSRELSSPICSCIYEEKGEQKVSVPRRKH